MPLFVSVKTETNRQRFKTKQRAREKEEQEIAKECRRKNEKKDVENTDRTKEITLIPCQICIYFYILTMEKMLYKYKILCN